MSTYQATVDWRCDGEEFLTGRYSRLHTIAFDGGLTIQGSSAVASVPLPWSVEAAVDPEEMFVAALSSCHMLWFLDLARRAGVAVDRYRDEAEGVLAPGPDGVPMMTRVVLRPRVGLSDPSVGADRLAELHHRAHDACFIARSVRTEVVVQPVPDPEEESRHG